MQRDGGLLMGCCHSLEGRLISNSARAQRSLPSLLGRRAHQRDGAAMDGRRNDGKRRWASVA